MTELFERLPSIESLIERGALFIANHSGGKDSQAMLIKMLEQIPAKQILVAHASLGEAEWPGALEHAEEQARAAGCAFVVARAVFENGLPKSFFAKVEHQFRRRPTAPSWPSMKKRWCTGELKTGPIEREVRRYAKAHGFSLIVSCLGLRAQESTPRRKRLPFVKKPKLSVAGREWYEWLPIHGMTTLEVFCTIAVAGQDPHYAYQLGNERLSCVFCIFGSRGDLRNGAEHHPELLAKYVALEKKTGYPMHMSLVPLEELVMEAAA